MARVVVIEVLGGPLDGKILPWNLDAECMVWTDGSRLYQHALDEQWTGKLMRKVLRLVQTVPMPKRKQ
jgi:hypothetical protein